MYICIEIIFEVLITGGGYKEQGYLLNAPNLFIIKEAAFCIRWLDLCAYIFWNNLGIAQCLHRQGFNGAYLQILPKVTHLI